MSFFIFVRPFAVKNTWAAGCPETESGSRRAPSLGQPAAGPGFPEPVYHEKREPDNRKYKENQASGALSLYLDGAAKQARGDLFYYIPNP